MDEYNDKKPFSTKKHCLRAKLIFNPSAGAARTSPIEIVDGPGDPVEDAAGFQLTGSLAGMVRRSARGRLGFPGL